MVKRHQECKRITRNYGECAADRILRRNLHQLRKNLRKIRMQTGGYHWPEEELWNEMVKLFHKNFEDYYETDNQYLRFLFISMKNKVRSMQRKSLSYNKRYKGRVILRLGDEYVEYDSQFDMLENGKTLYCPQHIQHGYDEYACEEKLSMRYFDDLLEQKEMRVLKSLVDLDGNWEAAFVQNGVQSLIEKREIKEAIKGAV